MAIAIARLPAKVPVTDPRYGGAILINPGGPGGSGVSFVARGGRQLQTIVSSSEEPSAFLPTSKYSNDKKELYYDIIGFDPRGVNNTTPRSSCFRDDASSMSWIAQTQAQGFPYSNETFAGSWIRAVALGRSCAARAGAGDEDDDSSQMGRHMSTPSVVEDMVAIIEALGEWREEEAKSLARQGKSSITKEIMESTKWKKGHEKLLYWGFSYGTVLGATFASMHPDRVGRVALDGVVDTDDYYSGKCFYEDLWWF
jgi:pimeloyl-ACP methyl ester carboxylesterase